MIRSAQNLLKFVTAICVLTGEATSSDIENGEIKPDYTFESVKDIWKALED